MRLDPAVAEALSLDPSRTTVSSAGGGGGSSSASTAKITTEGDDGSERHFFIKSGSGSDAEIMFRGEHASLNAIHDSVPSLCPQSYGWGSFSRSSSRYFVVTNFLDISSRFSSRSTSASVSSPALVSKPASLAEKLAKLHTTPAPIPEGYSSPMFGFPVATCCGDTPQDNTFQSNWAEFFADNRLRFILARCERANGSDAQLRKLVEATASKVVPRLLADEHLNYGEGSVIPVVVHGDLWSGNVGRGVMHGIDGPPQDFVYDPSACYAHSEYELGIMKMFGGFGPAFWDEYHSLCPKTEPIEEYEDRVELYALYHTLNHNALFGGSYRSGAIDVMNRLLDKYGSS